MFPGWLYPFLVSILGGSEFCHINGNWFLCVFACVCVLFSPVCLSVIHNKDLLATIHLLVAMVRCFQPELDLPPNVKVEVVFVEVSLSSSVSTFCAPYLSQTHLVELLLTCGSLSFSSRSAKVASNQMCRRNSWQRKGEIDVCPVWLSECEKNLRFTSYALAFFNRDSASDSSSNTESEWEQSEVELMWHLECHPSSTAVY